MKRVIIQVTRKCALFSGSLLLLMFFTCFDAQAQNSDYDKALDKFTGENKFAIVKPDALDGILAPDFSGKTLDGQQIHLAGLRGKVVVLNFWFIACVPCRLEVQPLNEVVSAFKDKDVVFLSVAREKEEDLKQHLKSKPFQFQTIADPNTAILKDRYHVLGYPTTIVIDKTGKIRHYSLGGKIDEQAVRKDFEQKLIPIITKCLAENNTI